MVLPGCPVCGKELIEPEDWVDRWFDDDNNICRSFIVREMKCTNSKCPLHGKRLDIFFDYTRIDVDGDEIDIDELRKEYKKGSEK